MLVLGAGIFDYQAYWCGVQAVDQSEQFQFRAGQGIFRKTVAGYFGCENGRWQVWDTRGGVERKIGVRKVILMLTDKGLTGHRLERQGKSWHWDFKLDEARGGRLEIMINAHDLLATGPLEQGQLAAYVLAYFSPRQEGREAGEYFESEAWQKEIDLEAMGVYLTGRDL